MRLGAFLFVSQNGITDLSPLSNLTNLEQLQIGGDAITDLSPLSGLTGLTWLPKADLLSLTGSVPYRRTHQPHLPWACAGAPSVETSARSPEWDSSLDWIYSALG